MSDAQWKRLRTVESREQALRLKTYLNRHSIRTFTQEKPLPGHQTDILVPHEDYDRAIDLTRNFDCRRPFIEAIAMCFVLIIWLLVREFT
jgi:hypothetical protein